MIVDVKIAGDYYELFDANNNRLDYVVRADTETGQIERYLLDGSSKPPLTIGGELLTEIVFVPCPLKVIKRDSFDLCD